MKTLVAVLALAIVAVSAPAQAQAEPTGMTLKLTSAGTIAFKGTSAIPFILEVGCLDLLQNAGASTTVPVAVEVTDAKPWLTVTNQTVEVDPTACIAGQGRVNVTGSIPITVSAAAPAVVLHTVHAVAKMDSIESTEPGATFTVAYNSNYTLTPSVKFPLTVTNKTTTFTLTGVQASNAPSMIMVDPITISDGALFSGIGPLQYANKAGTPDTKTYAITFTAPTGDWEKATVTLPVYGHYNFDGMAGDPTDRKTFTFEFVNGGVHDEHKDGGKKSPAPAAVLTALGLLAFAGVRRRKD
ncbi:MAG: hypothetical protein AABY18_07905 [Candidatus Thermoplasmatota archaeon]